MLFDETIPKRVVSLIPSYTESLFELGIGSGVVGITDFCDRPAEKLKQIARVGGPKNPCIQDILQLQPDLVIANPEENPREAVVELQAAGIPVWVTFPQTVADALRDLWTLARLFRKEAAQQRLQVLERSLEWVSLAAKERPSLRCFCPIWQDRLETGETWWMTFNSQTYSSDLLRSMNVENVFARRERRFPLLAELEYLPAEDPAGRDVRYPRVSRQEVLAASPEIILLPDEPYHYQEEDIASFQKWFAGTPAVDNRRILCVDGSLLTWYGTRLALALNELPALFD